MQADFKGSDNKTIPLISAERPDRQINDEKSPKAFMSGIVAD